MISNQGFSLTEVLVSLFLVMSLSLVLLQQQCQVSHLFNQVYLHNNSQSQIENAAEQIHDND